MPDINPQPAKPMERVTGFAKNFMTIYSVMVILVGGVAWAGDQYMDKYMQKSEFFSYMEKMQKSEAKMNISNEIKTLNKEIADLKIALRYATKVREKNRIEDTIIAKEAEIANLKEEQARLDSDGGI